MLTHVTNLVIRVTKFVTKISYRIEKTFSHLAKNRRQIIKICSELHNINIYARERGVAQSGGRRAKDNGKIRYFGKNGGEGRFLIQSPIKILFYLFTFASDSICIIT